MFQLFLQMRVLSPTRNPWAEPFPGGFFLLCCGFPLGKATVLTKKIEKLIFIEHLLYAADIQVNSRIFNGIWKENIFSILQIREKEVQGKSNNSLKVTQLEKWGNLNFAAKVRLTPKSCFSPLAVRPMNSDTVRDSFPVLPPGPGFLSRT